MSTVRGVCGSSVLGLALLAACNGATSSTSATSRGTAGAGGEVAAGGSTGNGAGGHSGGASATGGRGGGTGGEAVAGGAAGASGSGAGAGHAGSGGNVHAGAGGVSSTGGAPGAGGVSASVGGSNDDGGAGGGTMAGGSGDAGAGGSSMAGSSDGGSGGSSDGGAGGAALSGCGAPFTPGNHDESILSGGILRTYRLHVPPGYDSAKPTTLIFVWHGFTETSANIEKISRMTPASDSNGFLVVYPQGLNTSWNAGTCCGTSMGTVDDVAFFDALLAKLEGAYCIDDKRVFSAGLSNGAMFSQRLGCERADKIAAIGPVAGTLALNPCTPSRPVPVIEFHGTADPLVAYNGGGLANGASVPATIATWQANDGCTDSMPTMVSMNGDARCTEENMCAGGSAVRLCKIDGGGHQWPGGTTAGPFGKLSTDIDATAEMIQFFAAHPMP